jgi:hypothetical protein
MTNLDAILDAEIRAARRHGDGTLANQLESIREASDPAGALESAASSATGGRADTLRDVARQVGGSEPEAGGPETGGRDEPKTWTQEEWEAAAERTHKMSDQEFEDWDRAPADGRVEPST